MSAGRQGNVSWHAYRVAMLAASVELRDGGRGSRKRHCDAERTAGQEPLSLLYNALTPATASTTAMADDFCLALLILIGGRTAVPRVIAGDSRNIRGQVGTRTCVSPRSPGPVSIHLR